MLNNISSLAYGHQDIPADHVALNLQPDGQDDPGLIVLSHAEATRVNRKQKEADIAAAAGTDRAAAVATVDSRLSTSRANDADMPDPLSDQVQVKS